MRNTKVPCCWQFTTRRSPTRPPRESPGLGGNHGSSTEMLRQIDTILDQKGWYPHAFLSAHAPQLSALYAHRATGRPRSRRAVHRLRQRRPQPQPDGESFEGPAGAGTSFGSKVDYLDVKPAVTTGGLILEKYNNQNYGYLRISVDAQQLRIGFHVAQNGSLPQSQFDLVTVDLASHTMVAN